MFEEVGKDMVHKPYSEMYKQKCKICWYDAGCPKLLPDIISILPKDEFGRVPKEHLIDKWRTEEGWETWAEVLDTRAMAQIEDRSVQERVAMLKRQADYGKKLQEKGMTFLEAGNFDTAASAVNAVIRGAELERTSLGFSENLTKLLKMSDDELKNKAAELMSRLPDSEKVIIDVAPVEESQDTETE